MGVCEAIVNVPFLTIFADGSTSSKLQIETILSSVVLDPISPILIRKYCDGGHGLEMHKPMLWKDHLPNSVVLLASRDLPRAYLF